MKTVILTLVLSLSFAMSTDAAVTVTDNGLTIPTGFATGNVNTLEGFADPLLSAFGWNETRNVGQTFTLASAIELESIFIAYRGFNIAGSTATFTITVDAGNDGSNEISEQATLAADDFETGASANGNQSWMKWDLSSNNLMLPVGVSSFFIDMDSTTVGFPVPTLLAVYQVEIDGADGYLGGKALGTADDFLQPGEQRDLGFAVQATTTSVPGDFDGNGDVDGFDFLLWQRGLSPTPLSPADLAAWEANFGGGGGSGLAVSVPEPSTTALVGIALVGFVSYGAGHRRKKKILIGG